MRAAVSRRLLPPRVEPGIDPALEARERLQAFRVRERQELHQDHAGDVARRVDPEIGAGRSRPAVYPVIAMPDLGGIDDNGKAQTKSKKGLEKFIDEDKTKEEKE